jgi:hypothetical protein
MASRERSPNRHGYAKPLEKPTRKSKGKAAPEPVRELEPWEV